MLVTYADGNWNWRKTIFIKFAPFSKNPSRVPTPIALLKYWHRSVQITWSLALLLCRSPASLFIDSIANIISLEIQQAADNNLEPPGSGFYSSRTQSDHSAGTLLGLALAHETEVRYSYFDTLSVLGVLDRLFVALENHRCFQ